ncbi:MAG: hypothetical protein A2Y62_10900 [Candidatus Fischerbacteria bacterium RBG_13_37_8]|uniref:Signal peptidase I n=1 Tax=Candidatus Fischerbacteria bacterium RBG_13_37_8 TaxID=1817863 RepID=A0A1F5VUP6_9BACT|nr:MAG: hypothetical protein A2Y62_10900 [Candidatus Fischerbacteria bacterium RBG_13_37_8]
MTESSNKQDISVFPFHGCSMLPFIQPGSSIHLETGPSVIYKRGDIICFIQNTTSLFAHRLVSFTYRNGILHVVEKGDNIYGFSLIRYDKLIGKASRIEQNNTIIDLSSPYWRTINYLLALLASLQVTLLKIFPYSYHFDSPIKKIPHYPLKLLFKIITKISLYLK